MGALCGMIHGATNVVPCPSFNGAACVEALEAERCTSIYGTPTMFIDILAAARIRKPDVSHVETGIMAGEEIKNIFYIYLLEKYLYFMSRRPVSPGAV